MTFFKTVVSSIFHSHGDQVNGLEIAVNDIFKTAVNDIFHGHSVPCLRQEQASTLLYSQSVQELSDWEEGTGLDKAIECHGGPHARGRL